MIACTVPMASVRAVEHRMFVQPPPTAHVQVPLVQVDLDKCTLLLSSTSSGGANSSQQHRGSRGRDFTHQPAQRAAAAAAEQ